MTNIESHVDRLRQILSHLGVNPDPIIVLGMHRSGTTMLVRVLQGAGVFMGSRLSSNLEPRVFQDANRQIFDYFGAGWLNPELLPQPDIFHGGFSGLAMNIAERLGDDMGQCFFSGKENSCVQWGFKDPRNSVTAGLFLRIFPNARALFIYRKPLDVAVSIAVREMKRKRKYPGNEKFEFSEDELTSLLMRSVNLWETYNERAINVLPLFTSHTVLCYENILDNPESELSKALSIMELSISREKISAMDIAPQISDPPLDLTINPASVKTYISNSKICRKLGFTM